MDRQPPRAWRKHPTGCLERPHASPFLLREGTAGKAKPQAKVTMLGGGSESREVQGHTKANTASSNPNVSLPGKESLLAANRNVPKVILMKAFCSAMARTKTTLSLFNYFRHTQEQMPKTCTNLRIKATSISLRFQVPCVEATGAGGRKAQLSGRFAGDRQSQKALMVACGMLGVHGIIINSSINLMRTLSG